jgi:hypothetical protein
MLQRECLGDHAAQGKPDDVRGRHRAGIQRVHDIPNQIVECQRTFDVSGLPMPAQVEPQYAKRRSQSRGDLIPACAIRTDAVDQDHRRLLAAVVPIS